MTPGRVGRTFLIGFLVLTPFLGFAAGDVAQHIWEKHPRHGATQPADGPQFVWKTTPGTLTVGPAPVLVALLGRLSVDPLTVTLPAVVRPPFVPPRA